MSTTSVTLFVDTNLFLQCRDCKDVPWKDLGAFDAIELVVCRPIQREIDNHKAGGHPRRSRKAKAAAKLLREVITNKLVPVVILPEGPKVTVSLRLTLKPAAVSGADSVDDQLVAIAWGYKNDNPNVDVRILSDDTGVLASAEATGVPLALIPDDWFLEPEEGAAEKELRAAKAEASRLRKAEPAFNVACIDDSRSIERLEVTYQLYPELSDDEVNELVEKACLRFPKVPMVEAAPVEQPPIEEGIFDLARLGVGLPATPPTSTQLGKFHEAYDKWVKELRSSLVSLHRRLTRPIIVTFGAGNIGTRPADDVLVEIEGQGRFFVSRPPKDDDDVEDDGDQSPSHISLPSPPAYPKWRSSIFEMMTRSGLYADRFSRNLDYGSILHRHVSKPRDPEGFYYRPDGSEYGISLTCDLWRHGRQPEMFTVALSPESDETVEGLLTFSIHASNLSDAATLSVPVRMEVETRSTYEEADALLTRLEAKEIS